MTTPLFDPYNAKLDEPWEQLAADRQGCPVAYSPHLDAVQISSYQGVKEFLAQHQDYTGTYSTLWPRTEPLPVDEQVFSSADQPRHTRQRKLFVRALSASRIATMRPFSEKLVNQLVDDIIEAGDTFALGPDFAMKVTAGHVAELLDIPEADRERFAYLSGLFERSTAGTGDDELIAQMDEWHRQLADVVAERRAAGEVDDDLITKLCFAEEDGDRLTELEVAALIRAMIRAGNTTTAATIINTVHALESHPEQKARYIGDIDGLTTSLVQEGLRYDGPVLGLWRRCSRDTSVAGHPLPAGQRVFTVTAAANHDPAVYDRADEFVVDRDWRNLPGHLSFGHGIHHCIGMNLAFLECEVALSTLYRRLPGLRLDEESTPVQAPGPVVRGWIGVRMRYDRDVLATGTKGD
ncbi:Cytochrome P450 [Lentzea xinjiangensis]|uniref:Cytochrome P450 n=1 Tax=Lentzea xinjiangensis TaxID=402600 RepID=A0A1H9NJY9_9PSEU|nr:cytochrome P450 [Lentzea xinjiangensis]SER36211.1 Cytochrome P450 [Lentzea xinjiangensis]